MDEIVGHYSEASECNRLTSGIGLLERERTLEILARFLPEPPALILDVGGATGVYAFPLVDRGYHVRLIDLTPRHVEQARQSIPASRRAFRSRSGRRQDASLRRSVGRWLPLAGPALSPHRSDTADCRALEARRILRPGGTLVAAAITRFASLLDGLARGFVEDQQFLEMLRNDLTSGQHRNPTSNPTYFTTAYFHRPEELESELAEAGFQNAVIFAVQGPGWLRKDFEQSWHCTSEREKLLALIRAVGSRAELALHQPAHHRRRKEELNLLLRNHRDWRPAPRSVDERPKSV